MPRVAANVAHLEEELRHRGLCVLQVLARAAAGARLLPHGAQDLLVELAHAVLQEEQVVGKVVAEVELEEVEEEAAEAAGGVREAEVKVEVEEAEAEAEEVV